MGVNPDQIRIWYGKYTPRFADSPFDSEGNFQEGFGDGDDTITIKLRKKR